MVNWRHVQWCWWGLWGSVAAALVSAWIVAASVPADLSNFQNEYACDVETTLVVRPRTVEDIMEAVKRYDIVRPNGMGHSWNRPFLCSNASTADNSTVPGGARIATKSGQIPSAVNIQLSTLRPLQVEVDESNAAVWVDAGVLTIDLLDYLASYVTKTAPSGWTLGAFPWYVYQTIGGAVSTGTHGSSTLYNSLSDQVLALEMVVANGTRVTLNPDTHPFLMRAARVGVGRLGIITRLKLKIIKEQPVRREVRPMPVTAFLSLMDSAAATYRSTGALPAELQEAEVFWQTQRSEMYLVTFARGDSADPGVRRGVLESWEPDFTTVYDTSRAMLRDPNVTRMDDLPLKAGVQFTASGLTQDAQTATDRVLKGAINKPLPNFPAVRPAGQNNGPVFDRPVWRRLPNAGQRVTAASGEGEGLANGTTAISPGAVGVPWAMPRPRTINLMYGQEGSAGPLMDVNKAGVLILASNMTLEASKAYLHQPEALEFQIKGILFDQYEVSFPLDKAGECLTGLMKTMYGDDLDSAQPADRLIDRGFRSAPLFRLVGKEDGLLAQTGDGARMFLNIEDYLYYNRAGGRSSNIAFKKLVGYLRSAPACGSTGLQDGGGRLHWGKAGWPDAGCWHGDREYPDTWCDFGCAVRELDPGGKFVGAAPDRWTWKGVDLDACCTPTGFSTSKPGCTCRVQHERDASTCPPPPYYTYR